MFWRRRPRGRIFGCSSRLLSTCTATWSSIWTSNHTTSFWTTCTDWNSQISGWAQRRNFGIWGPERMDTWLRRWLTMSDTTVSWPIAFLVVLFYSNYFSESNHLKVRASTTQCASSFTFDLTSSGAPSRHLNSSKISSAACWIWTSGKGTGWSKWWSIRGCQATRWWWTKWLEWLLNTDTMFMNTFNDPWWQSRSLHWMSVFFSKIIQ